MLRNTFCHLPNVGIKTEKAFWRQGILDWEDFLRQAEIQGSPGRIERLLPHVNSSLQELDKNNPEFFAEMLPNQEKWRLFWEFSESTAYIDIETTGTGKGLDHITTIALYDGNHVYTFVHGRNLEEFSDQIRDYGLVVTFNGACFDIPFIEKELGIVMPRAHIDLRFVLKSLGYKGGLKKCEHWFGLDRGNLDGVDGYWAVLMWSAFENTGDERILETLLAYNVEDVLSLELLLCHAYNLKIAELPLDKKGICIPSPGLNPYRVHGEIMERIG